MSEENKNKCECDCECEHGEEDDVVMLEDEQGNEIAFHYVTTLEHEGKDYVYLQAASEDEEDDGIEIYELETVEGDGDAEGYDSLYPVEDELYEVLYAKLMKLIEEEGCDCDEEECRCHEDGCDCGNE